VTLRYEKKNDLAYFIIDNGKVNVFTPAVHKEFYHRLKEFESDPDVRAGIFMGADGRSFSAGEDVKNRHRPPRTRQQELEAYLFPHQNEGETPTRPGWDLDAMRHRRYKPIVAAVNGYCLGQGLVYLLLHSDIRICAEDAVFGLPEIAFGAAGMSAVTRLARHIPYTAAAWMALTGEFVDAQEAYRIHLVNRVVPAVDVLAAAEAVALKIARHPPTAVRVEMEALEMGADMSRDDAAHHGQNLYRLHRLSFEEYEQAIARYFAERSKTV
jgi:E-phenylitaconyl-CoA hydratase